MATELAVYQERGLYTWQEMKEQARELVPTGFLPESIKTPQQAMAIMLTGKELGLPPMQAIRGINIIKGNPTIKPELMLAMCLQRIPGFQYEFRNCDNKSATFACKRPSMMSEYVSTFTMEDAKTAGLTGNPSWTKYPGNMLRWRAVANALHIVAPDVLVGIYTPEEIGAEVNADGSVTSEWQQQNAPEPITVEAEIVEDDKATPNDIRRIHAIAGQKFGKTKDVAEESKAKFKAIKEQVLGADKPSNEMTVDEINQVCSVMEMLPDYEQAA
jgi:hypothetical protein